MDEISFKMCLKNEKKVDGSLGRMKKIDEKMD